MQEKVLDNRLLREDNRMFYWIKPASDYSGGQEIELNRYGTLYCQLLQCQSK